MSVRELQLKIEVLEEENRELLMIIKKLKEERAETLVEIWDMEEKIRRLENTEESSSDDE